MRASRLWLGSGVVIEAAGDQLAFRQGDAIVARVATPERRDAAIVAGELWVIDRDGWSRYALDASRVGERIERPVHHTALTGPGFLVVSGGRATWNGRDCAQLATDTGVEVVAGAEAVVPISRTTRITVAANAVRLQQQGVDVWRAQLPGRVLAAAPLFGGRSVALVVGDRVHRIVVLDTRDGNVHHRIRIDDLTQVAFASERGWAALRVGDRRVLLFDLRFGHHVREHLDRDAIEEVAIDDVGHQVALWRAGEAMARVLPTSAGSVWLEPADEPAPNGAHEQHEDAKLVQEPVVEPPAREQEAEAPAPAPPPPVSKELDRDAPLGLLHPIAAAPKATADEAAEVMRRHVALIAALVERAVAEAWDSGRLAPAAAGGFLYASELDGILGLTTGHASERLRAAEQRVQQAQSALLDIVRSIEPRRAPLTELALEFGLTPLAADVLMVVAAPILWGELARAYAILANDLNRPLCDELLVCQILAPRAARRDIARTLDRDRPLRHFGLITVGSGGRRPFDPLRPDPLVIRRLRALPLDADIEPNLRILPATRRLEDMILPPGVADAALTALSAPPGELPVRIVTRGRLGSGRRTLLAALAERAGRRLVVIDGAYYAHEPALRATQLELALGRAHLRGWLPCVENLDDLGENDRVARQRIVDVFRTHPGPVALRLAWDAQVPLDPGYVDLELPVLAERDRTQAWSQAIARHQLSVVEPATLAARFRLGPGTIERVCEAVAQRTQVVEPGLDHSRALDLAARQHLSRQLGAHAQQVRRLSTWADVVLPPDVMDSVLELTSRIRHRRKVFEEWGYDERISTSRGITALFQGSPGTGKTLVASAIARDLGLDLYRVDLSRVVSKWVGETERNLANLFDAAEDGQAIILFDEADSLFAKRTEVRTSVDRYANLEVNYLLQRLDSFEGIALLTTNFGGSIDRAFQRRLTLRLTFPFPDDEMREQLWRVHIPERVPRRGTFDLGMLARKYRLSGGYIRNACLRAAFLAAEDGGALTQEHLERAVRLEFREIGKLGDGGVLE